MKKYIPIITILLVSSLSMQAQSFDYISPGENRELPRTRTVAYNSEAEALAQSTEESRFFQPLEAQWSRESLPDGGVAFSHPLKVPFAWVDREVFVYIGSANGPVRVYVNGTEAGHSLNAYTALEFDVTKLATEGANTLRIEVGNSGRDISGREQGQPAITGEVYAFAQPRVRIRDFVTRTIFDGPDASVELGVITKSHLLNTKEVTIHYKIFDQAGAEVASGRREAEFRMRGEDTVRFIARIRDAKPWSHETPYLYTLLLRTQHEGRYTEYIPYTLGLRNVEVKEGKLLINSFEPPYSAAPWSGEQDREATETRLRELKDSGYNMVVVTGGPQPSYFYDLCDLIGIYVCDQAAVNTSSWGASREKGENPSNDPRERDLFVDRALTAYHTSYNHPSVIMYSPGEASANGYNLYESYLALKEAEKERPVVYFGADGEWNTDAVSSSLTVTDPQAAGSRLVFDISKNELAARSIEPEVIYTETPGLYKVRNTSFVTPLRAELRYTVKQGLKKISEGSLPVDIRPLSEQEFIVPADGAKAGARLKYEVELIRR